MGKEPALIQDPLPGRSCVMYTGDCLTLRLTLSFEIKGRAFVRTDLGAAVVTRNELIKRVEKDEIKLGEAWVDLPMTRDNDLSHIIVLPLIQTGHFQAKCFFLPDNRLTPLWPPGDNLVVNVEPAGTCCANIIYNAFVRQFGPTKAAPVENDRLAPAISELDEKGYTVIPESGKFRDLIKEIPFIFSRLGCRVLHLLPIHPTPTTYARMGRFGSPYAALNFTDVDPALAEFDPSATPLEQFLELVDAVHYHHGYLFMDIAINHTGWAASIHESHPDWLVRDESGRIEVPGAWGVEWADLTRLDYSNTDLWQYMAGIFLRWCRRGVDGFRCDAGYMIPVEAWQYIVAKVRQEYPDTLFFLEGLGGPLESTRQILGRANFNWAYSELFQNYTTEEITAYLHEAYDISNTCGHLIHFAETHDNNRLASVSTCYARMRTALCAMFSICGGFGFANGVEWFATQKIDVHESSSLNWDSKDNQVDHIARLNRILSRHPAFFSGTRLSMISSSQAPGMVLSRHNAHHDKRLLILVNPDCDHNCELSWKSSGTGAVSDTMADLISLSRVHIDRAGGVCRIKLAPGQVMALSHHLEDLNLIQSDAPFPDPLPGRVYLQKLKEKILQIHTAVHGFSNVMDLELTEKARAFARNPVQVIRAYNKQTRESRVVVFDVQRDARRQVMVLPGHFLMVQSRERFRARLMTEKRSGQVSLAYEEGISRADGSGFFAVFLPRQPGSRHRTLTLEVRQYIAGKSQVVTMPLIYLAPFHDLAMSTVFNRKEIVSSPFLKVLGTTRLGGMMRAAAWWGRLDSRYDGLMGANMSSEIPENRHMVVSRYRIWAVFQGYSRELAPDCLERFRFSYDGGGEWRFHVPTSEGNYYALILRLALDRKANHLILSVARPIAGSGESHLLDNEKPITLIIRPDIEDRSFHETVKAYKGPEKQWPANITASDSGFLFKLSNNRSLRLFLTGSRYVHEPEWHYMIHRPIEADRGLDPDSDLFSPGYFTLACKGGDEFALHAVVAEGSDPDKEMADQSVSAPLTSFESTMGLEQALSSALDAFIVDRGPDKSVIAGYPWFLDWGRDSLIFCRALIELERFEEAKAVLRLFGGFEREGTLPNMICGQDAGNIETSDAPLWFFACCRDLVEKQGKDAFLEESLNGRSVREILLSIARSLLSGTPTGVRADPQTLLLYSPSHFTWMDTNFPAGSPRQGYPVEIQALWHHALTFLAGIDKKESDTWLARAAKVEEQISQLFYNDRLGYFSDCLHCDGPVSAVDAVPDDALRPNQLFLFSLGVIQERQMAQKSVESCLELLVPGAIRSLADRKLEYPLHIFYNDRLLNDPHDPYEGKYTGDEDTRRKPAYHNGTAWTWPFPVFCEAWAAVFGPGSHSTCLAWLGSVLPLMRKGAAGYIPEIVDGDFPHTPRGCDAQAWGVSEAARVIHKLCVHE